MKNSLIGALLILVGVTQIQAQIPRTLSYQGILSDTLGVPKPDGVYGMTFRIYPVSQSGSPLWSETQAVGTRRGLFSAVLGDISPFPDTLRFDRRYWLGIQVSPDPELTPRIQLTATGYSIRSRTADTAQYARTAPGSSFADSSRIAGTVPDNSIMSGKITSGQVVKSLNNLHDAVTLRAQGGATITSNGDTITINSGAGGGGTGIQGIQNTDNTLLISSPTGPTATVNTRVPLSLNGNWNGEQGALQILGDKPTIRLTGGSISGNESWMMQLGSDVPGNLSFFRRSGAATWTNVMSLATNGNVGIGTVTPFAKLEVTSGTEVGISGNSSAPGRSGVWGLNDDANGEGVHGESLYGVGVRGTSFSNDGIVGSSSVRNRSGVYGFNDGGPGVSGHSDYGTGVSGTSTNGAGVHGSSAFNDGIVGTSATSSHSGVWGHNDVTGGVGVAGSSNGGTGVSGTSLTGVGIVGGSSLNDGIVGSSSASNHSGVWGHNDVPGGVGVAGSSVGGTGVSGTSTNETGVYGGSTNASGLYGATGSGGASGVYGINNATQTFGAIGLKERRLGWSDIGVGVMGDAGTPVAGYPNENYAIHGITHDAGQIAGYFDGRVVVTTDLQVKGSKNFQIDDPLEPTKKYLLHSCVESDVRMNIYHGTITTDATGDATVVLPRWFSALNTDFHYQLTVIGQFALAIVSREISSNQFSIKTDKPDVKVSWQVTGVRNDAYAKAHPMQVEVEKPAGEKGTYSHPELYGLPPRTFDFKPAGQVDQTKKEKQ